MSRPDIELRFAPELRRQIRALSRRYLHIRSDLRPVLEQLGSGQLPGDQIPGTDYRVFKARVRDTDIPKGKTSGCRLIYEARSPVLIVLVAVYSKLDQGDISPQGILRFVEEFDSRGSRRS